MTYQEFYNKSIQNPEEYWLKEAFELAWFSPPKKGLSQDENSLYRWFKGGELNTSYLMLDYHIENGRGNQAAIIYDSPVTNTQTTYSYYEALDQVEKVAGMLKNLGVQKGDRVVIYMPMIPETVFAMIACARIGAVHSVVFGGFAAHELAIRIDDSTPKVLLTASCGIEIDKIIPYKPLVDKAIQEAKNPPNHVVVFQRKQLTADLNNDIDLDWEEQLHRAQPAPYVTLDATDPLYILYTSGTTGKPKGIIRDNGGHAVALHASMKYVYGVKPGDVYCAASDVGWVVGHSYIVYAPLLMGCTTVLFEGKPIKTPDAGTYWRMIEEHKINVFFTAPTAFRAIKKEDFKGQLASTYDLSSLRYLFLAGERCDATTLNWLKDLIQIPVIDHWWQTESGFPMLANYAGYELQQQPDGSAGKPNFGFDIRILKSDQTEASANEEGVVVVKYPLPPGCLPNLWQDTERFMRSYLSLYPGYYFSGDGGYKDETGNVFITGRIDDIINVAGHRLSTAEMEEVVAAHEAVAECAVVGVEDELKGQIPVGFVVLKSVLAHTESEIMREIITDVRNQVGPVASFKKVVFVKRLPKTRSGKTLRKIIRAIADNKPFETPSTIEDITVLDELKQQLRLVETAG